MDLDIFYCLRWIHTPGGPHLLLAEELLSSWEGIGDREDEDEPDTLDPSDYTRACRIIDRLIGVIPCSNGHALVLDAPKVAIAWIPTLGRSGGFLAQPFHTVDETDLRNTLLSSLVAEALHGPGAEKTRFSTGPSGIMRLFASAAAGHWLGAPGSQPKFSGLEYEVLALEPGRYQMRAAFVKTDSMEINVREIIRDTGAVDFS